MTTKDINPHQPYYGNTNEELYKPYSDFEQLTEQQLNFVLRIAHRELQSHLNMPISDRDFFACIKKCATCKSLDSGTMIAQSYHIRTALHDVEFPKGDWICHKMWWSTSKIGWAIADFMMIKKLVLTPKTEEQNK